MKEERIEIIALRNRKNIKYIIQETRITKENRITYIKEERSEIKPEEINI